MIPVSYKIQMYILSFFGSNIKSIKKLLIGQWFDLSVQLFNLKYVIWFGFMEFNAIFNNISGISCRSVLLVEETAVPGENQGPAASRWHTLSHNVVPMENNWNKKSIYCKI